MSDERRAKNLERWNQITDPDELDRAVLEDLETMSQGVAQPPSADVIPITSGRSHQPPKPKA